MLKLFFITILLLIAATLIAQKSPHTRAQTTTTSPNSAPTSDTGFIPATKSGNAAAARKMPAGPGKRVVVRICGDCHELTVVTKERKTRDQWINTIKDMTAKGMNASDDDMLTTLDYLSKYYSPKKSAKSSKSATAQPLGDSRNANRRRPSRGVTGL